MLAHPVSPGKMCLPALRQIPSQPQCMAKHALDSIQANEYLSALGPYRGTSLCHVLRGCVRLCTHVQRAPFKASSTCPPSSSFHHFPFRSRLPLSPLAKSFHVGLLHALTTAKLQQCEPQPSCMYSVTAMQTEAKQHLLEKKSQRPRTQVPPSFIQLNKWLFINSTPTENGFYLPWSLT